MSDEYRFGDETPPAERSQRLYQEEPHGAWYFRTREGTPMGPFETSAEALQALDDFIEFIRLADLQTLSELTRVLAADEEAAVAVQDGPAAAPPQSLNVVADSVGAWDPQTERTQPSAGVLLDLHRRFIANGAATARGVLTGAEVTQFAAFMHCDPASWPPSLAVLDSAGLIALVRFFTLAEQELPGWQAGSKSPAIACARELRHRGDYPADLTMWIRQHSDNRFLPYGSLLDRI